MKTKFLIILIVGIAIIGILIGTISQIDLYDYNKYSTVFGPGSPLADKGTGNPVLTQNNCDRYTHWLTEHQKEKITLQEDFSERYPPWGNQIFPLVNYCTKIGQFDKTLVNGAIKWKFSLVRQGMPGLPSEPELDPMYIKEKIRELEEMPCEEMSENHVHEIEDPEHYAAYDKKFIECFGYIP